MLSHHTSCDGSVGVLDPGKPEVIIPTQEKERCVHVEWQPVECNTDNRGRIKEFHVHYWTQETPGPDGLRVLPRLLPPHLKGVCLAHQHRFRRTGKMFNG